MVSDFSSSNSICVITFYAVIERPPSSSSPLLPLFLLLLLLLLFRFSLDRWTVFFSPIHNFSFYFALCWQSHTLCCRMVFVQRSHTHKHICLLLCALYALLSSLFLIATKLWYLFPEFCQLSASFHFALFGLLLLILVCCTRVRVFVCCVERLSFDECGKINRRLHGTTAQLKSRHQKRTHFNTTD